jgi:hypothetical protein
MPVGAALAAGAIGSAVIGGVASNSAAHTQADAAVQSGQYQLQAAQLAAQLQLGMFNTIRGDLSPYRGVGTSALPGYYRLLGLPPPSDPGAGAPAPNVATGGGSLVIPGVNATGGLSAGIPGGVSAAGGAGGLVIPGINAPAGGSQMPALGSVNFTKLFQDRPDVMQAYQHLVATADRNSPTWQQHGLDSPEGFAQWWLANKPGADTYQAPTWSQADIDKLSTGAPGAGAGGAAGGGTGAGGQPAGSTSPLGGTDDIYAYLQSLPGYAWMRDQGIKSVTNAMSAKGLAGVSGPLAKGIARYVTGLADQTYGEQLSRLGGAVATGQNAAVQTGNAGTSAAGGASGALVGGAGAYGSSITGAANAIAAGQIGSANALSGAVNGVSNAYLTSKVLGMYGGGTPVEYPPI